MSKLPEFLTFKCYIPDIVSKEDRVTYVTVSVKNISHIMKASRGEENLEVFMLGGSTFVLTTLSSRELSRLLSFP